MGHQLQFHHFTELGMSLKLDTTYRDVSLLESGLFGAYLYTTGLTCMPLQSFFPLELKLSKNKTRNISLSDSTFPLNLVVSYNRQP